MIQRLLPLVGFLLSTIVLSAQGRFCFENATVQIKGGGTEFFIPAEELGDSKIIRISTRPLVTAYAYLVTDQNNIIIKVGTTNFVEIADLNPGEYRIWSFSYVGEITAEPGQNAGIVQLATFCSELTQNFIKLTIDGSNLFKVQILHHNDGESALLGSEGVGGVARFKQIIDEQRLIASQAGYPSLLFSAGDNFLAGPEFTASQRQLFQAPIYDAAAQSQFGYDGIAIGNHEFDFGPNTLAEYIRSTDPAYVPIGGATKKDIGRLAFLNDFSLPTQLEFEGTTFGGISSIDYDSTSGRYYLIADDANNARYYTANLTITEAGIQDVTIDGVTNLQTPEGGNFPDGSVDPEAIRWDADSGTLVWTSEGNINNLVPPFVREMNPDGSFVQSFELPALFEPDTTNELGPRQNGVFEGITFTVDGSEVVTMLELPLKQDGVVPNIDPTNSPVRMIFFDRSSGRVNRQFAYQLDPVAQGGSTFQINGVVEVLAYSETSFLVMERSAFFDPAGSGNIVRIFKADISEATDISGLDALVDADYKPVEKELLITIDNNSFPFENPVDNIEGMTFGPTLPNGNPTLILVADDNFSAFGPQLSQFMAFEVFFRDVPPDGTTSNGAPPFLSANLDFSGEFQLQELADAQRIRKSTRIFRGGDVVGIIGLTTPELNFVSSPGNVEVFGNLSEIVAEEVASLQEKGVNKIILISHLQGIDEEIALISQLEDVDIVIAGGGDEFLTNDPEADIIDGLTDLDDVRGTYPLEFTDAKGETVYLVTAPGGYNYLGNLTVTFSPAGKVTSIDPVSGPKKVITDKPDEEILEEIVEPVQEFVAALEGNIIGGTQPELNGLRNDVRTKETNAGNLIADAILWQANIFAPFFNKAPADVAIQNGGGIRNSVVVPSGGQISELTTFRMLPFANFVVIVDPIPASQFKQIMERAVSQVENVRGQFAQIAGFEIVYDPNGQAQEIDENGAITTPGERIVTITLDDGSPIVVDGQVVEGASDISIATIDFLARGGDAYPFYNTPFTSIQNTYQQALFGYVIAGLGGNVFDDQYPEGGEGRIRTLGEGNFQDLENSFIQPKYTFSLNVSPNPVTEKFMISYHLEKAATTEIFLTDLQGKRLRTLFSGDQYKGKHQLEVKNLNVDSGTYFVSMRVGEDLQTIPFVK